MKQITIGVFTSHEDAERAVQELHRRLGLSHDAISYLYRNIDGETHEIDTRDIARNTPTEGAVEGAMIGGTLGTVAGIAAVAGVLPVIGPIFAAGPLVAALGLTGAVGTTVAAAATGVAAGGIVGALVSWGVDTDRAQRYEEHVQSGNMLVMAHAEANRNVKKVFEDAGAIEVQVYDVGTEYPHTWYQ